VLKWSVIEYICKNKGIVFNHTMPGIVFK